VRCVICNQEIPYDAVTGWEGGNNAEPISSGRCCDECNVLYVVPARIAQGVGR